MGWATAPTAQVLGDGATNGVRLRTFGVVDLLECRFVIPLNAVRVVNAGRSNTSTRQQHQLMWVLNAFFRASILRGAFGNLNLAI